MSTCPYILFEFFNSTGTKLGEISQDAVVNASWARSLNNIGTAVIEIPSDCTDWDFASVSQEDLGMLISVAQKQGQAPVPDLETFWFLRRFKEKIIDQKASYTLTFKDTMHLLDRRVVAYRSDDPEGSSPNAIINEPGNVALKRIFDTNYSTLATDTDRNEFPFLTSAGISTPSILVEKEIQWKSILRVMQQICRTSRDKGQDLFFDIVALPTASDVRFEYRTYLNQRGQDKTPYVIHTNHPFFKLTSFEIDYDVANVGYAGGIGRGQERQIAIATNARSTAGRFTRYEEFKSVRSGISDVLSDEAQNLVNNTAGIIRLEGQLLGDLAVQFNFGDRLLMSHRGLEIICEVTNIASTLANQEYTRTVVVKSVG